MVVEGHHQVTVVVMAAAAAAAVVVAVLASHAILNIEVCILHGGSSYTVELLAC